MYVMEVMIVADPTNFHKEISARGDQEEGCKLLQCKTIVDDVDTSLSPVHAASTLIRAFQYICL